MELNETIDINTGSLPMHEPADPLNLSHDGSEESPYFLPAAGRSDDDNHWSPRLLDDFTGQGDGDGNRHERSSTGNGNEWSPGREGSPGSINLSGLMSADENPSVSWQPDAPVVTPGGQASNSSLYGEDILVTHGSSHPASLSEQRIGGGSIFFSPALLSPSSDGDGTTTPPSLQSQVRTTLSPPPLHQQQHPLQEMNTQQSSMGYAHAMTQASSAATGGISTAVAENRSFASRTSQKRPPLAPQHLQVRMNHAHSGNPGAATGPSSGVGLLLSSSTTTSQLLSLSNRPAALEGHNRGRSGSDASFVSEMTDSDVEGGAPSSLGGLVIPTYSDHSLVGCRGQVVLSDQTEMMGTLAGDVLPNLLQPILSDSDIHEQDGMQTSRIRSSPLDEGLATLEQRRNIAPGFGSVGMAQVLTTTQSPIAGNFHYSTARSTPDKVPPSKPQSPLSRHGRRQSTPFRYSFQNVLTASLGQFETEAETLVLKAIEEEFRGQHKNDIQDLLFPTISDEAVSRMSPQKSAAASPRYDDRGGGGGGNIRRSHRPERTRKMSNLRDTTTHWLALQRVYATEEQTRVDNCDDVKDGQGSIHYTLFSDEDDVRDEDDDDDEAQDPDAHAGEKLAHDISAMMASARSRQRHAKIRSGMLQQSRISLVGSAKTSAGRPGGDRQNRHVDHGSVDSPDKSSDERKDVEAGCTPTSNGIGTPGAGGGFDYWRYPAGVARRIQQLKIEWRMLDSFVRPHCVQLRTRVSWIFWGIVFPSVSIAALLFYRCDNPPNGKNYEGETPSISWLLLFIGVRQVLTFALAQLSALIVVDYLTLTGGRFTVMIGPTAAMLIAQSKGWPCTLFFFGIYSLLLNSGSDEFAKHWGYWQHTIDMFNSTNPAGDFTTRGWIIRLYSLISAIGAMVTVKRLWIGIHLGTRLYDRYNQQLTSLMESMLLLSEIGILALQQVDTPKENHLKQKATVEDIDTSNKPPDFLNYVDPPSLAPQENSFPPGLNSTQKLDIINLLQDWDEPLVDDERTNRNSVAMNEILQFRQTFGLMQTDYPFSYAFGLAGARQTCVESSCKVYGRLAHGENELQFATLAMIATDREGHVDGAKLKRLAHLLIPNENGTLTVLDFVRSVDTCYRELRVVSANIRNATAMDRAYEKILNFGFCVLLGCFSLAIMGIDLLTFILSLSSIIVAFAFMIGPASSIYFEGVLMILVRRPYDIGDRIAFSDPNTESNAGGSNGWIVEKIDLFTTTLRFGMTREVATVANGSLARFRIINMKRSDGAQIIILLKFGVDVPFQKVKVFRKAVEQFVASRKREWVAFSSFRATRVESDLGFIEYVLSLQHRESWQSALVVLESKANVASFCLELQKQLDMGYVAPPQPVSLSVLPGFLEVDGKASRARGEEEGADLHGEDEASGLDEQVQVLAKLFEPKKTK